MGLTKRKTQPKKGGLWRKKDTQNGGLFKWRKKNEMDLTKDEHNQIEVDFDEKTQPKYGGLDE
jgi:hypothetical protein